MKPSQVLIEDFLGLEVELIGTPELLVLNTRVLRPWVWQIGHSPAALSFPRTYMTTSISCLNTRCPEKEARAP